MYRILFFFDLKTFTVSKTAPVWARPRTAPATRRRSVKVGAESTLDHAHRDMESAASVRETKLVFLLRHREFANVLSQHLLRPDLHGELHLL